MNNEQLELFDSLMASIPSLRNRARLVLRLFVEQDKCMDFSEVAENLGGTRTSWSWYVKELEIKGAIDRQGSRGFDQAKITPLGYLINHVMKTPRKPGIFSKKVTVGLHADGGTVFKKSLKQPEGTTMVLRAGGANKKLGSVVKGGEAQGQRNMVPDS